MTIKAITAIKSADEARQQAIDWQHSFDYAEHSYGDLIEWQGYFETLARKFNLTEEFKENGIL